MAFLRMVWGAFGGVFRSLSERGVLASVRNGLLVWAGEAAVGTVPLTAYEIVHTYSTQADQMPPATVEVCILSSVVSGLAVLSLFKSGLRKPPVTIGWLGYILGVFALVALLCGGLMYVLVLARISHDAEQFSYQTLMLALVSSLVIAIDRAVREA